MFFGEIPPWSLFRLLRAQYADDVDTQSLDDLVGMISEATQYCDQDRERKNSDRDGCENKTKATRLCADAVPDIL